ncbi:MAG: aspartate carbamoyltransferase [Candidatus Magasanikbacteria bacterium]
MTPLSQSELAALEGLSKAEILEKLSGQFTTRQKTFEGRDILSITDLSKEDIEKVLEHAKQLKQKPQPTLLQTYVMASCFFEPSTRTRLSFETAMKRLGGEVMGFADANVTSVKKKETIYDSMKIIGQYADVIVMRHPMEGSVRRAAEATDKPILNGGDGSNQHPTQTLLDLFTIKESQRSLEGLSIALVGDLKYGRTVHSLTQALTHFGAELHFIAPDSLKMPNYICRYLQKKNIGFTEHSSIEEVMPKVDILYITRIQGERFPDKMEYERVKNVFVLTKDMMNSAKPNMRILHPLPRVNEIEVDIDATPHAYYFQQAENGLYVRQALLGLVLGKLQ